MHRTIGTLSLGGTWNVDYRAALHMSLNSEHFLNAMNFMDKQRPFEQVNDIQYKFDILSRIPVPDILSRINYSVSRYAGRHEKSYDIFCREMRDQGLLISATFQEIADDDRLLASGCCEISSSGDGLCSRMPALFAMPEYDVFVLKTYAALDALYNALSGHGLHELESEFQYRLCHDMGYFFGDDFFRGIPDLNSGLDSVEICDSDVIREYVFNFVRTHPDIVHIMKERGKLWPCR